jgi:hypothetical protein
VNQTVTTLRRVVVLSLVFLLALGGSFTATVSAAPDKPGSGTISVPVAGTVTGTNPATGQALSAGTFQGTATITQFGSSSGQLVAIGTISGVVMDGGAVVDSIVSNFSAPVTMAPAAATTGTAAPAVTAAATSCSILNLTLGPIHLNLLGLVLDTNQIVVNLTAVPGAGNLLGNLLCSASNLLNGGIGANLSAIVNLLNQILAAL